jgi:hypothetical protein
MKDSLPSGALLLIVLLFADGGRHMPVPAIGNTVKGMTRAVQPAANTRAVPPVGAAKRR